MPLKTPFKNISDDLTMEMTSNITTSITNNLNISDGTILDPPEQDFVVTMYSVLLVIGAVGNISVFVALMRSRRRKSRVNLLMTHLVIADMMVTFIVIPLEIGWRTTNAWLAGNLACKIFLVLRAFGLYLSSNVLVCISLDRFFAIIYPLRLAVARKRSKSMLTSAWIVALLCSLPQSIVFRVMKHPTIADFEQCVSFNAFSQPEHELAYNVFCLCAMYFLPLAAISVCYLCIFWEISNNSKENSAKHHHSGSGRVMLRRSDQRPLARARRRTLRMTVTIVSVFACCWLPYATMTIWYMVDRKSAMHVSPRIQDLFFIMAVSNSCMDPLVYGTFTIDPRTFTRTFRNVFCIHNPTTDIPGINGQTTLKGKSSTKVEGGNHNNNVRRKSKFSVHFDDCLTARLSINSDPIVCSERSTVNIKQSHSCELFVMHSPPNVT